MFANTLSVTMDSGSVTLTRVNQDNFGSTYFGEDTNRKIELVISHELPKTRGDAGESHLVRFNVDHYSVDGVYLRRSSAWSVIKTFDGSQDADSSKEAYVALHGLVDATFAASVINRES